MPQECHGMENMEYDGNEVVKWGIDNVKANAGDCCDDCRSSLRCNAWVFCASASGCSGRKPGECWLKHVTNLNPMNPPVRASGEGVGWVGGLLYTQSQLDEGRKAHMALKTKEERRIQALRDNADLPMVYFDVAIKGEPVGRITYVLFSHISPRAAENFRALFSGEKGVVPDDGTGREGAGQPYHFKGKYFYRIIDRFIDQTGADVESVFGGAFKDDPGGLQLVHDRPGLMSCANSGPDTTTSHFSTMVAPAPHLNGHYSIFGEVVDGMDVVYKVNALSKGKKDNTAGREEGAQIVDSGQLRRGKPYVPE
eukprot:jgi/Botrbrau1/10522/Bobra.7_1s0006.3